MYFPQIFPIAVRRSILLLLLVLLLSACGTTPIQTSPTATPSAQAHVTPTVAATPTENVPTLSTPLVTYKGHQASVISIVWSPDGKEIASGGDDNAVRIWDAATGHTVLLYQGHKDIVFAVAWSPDGKLIASASNDDTVQVWRPAP